MTSRFDNLPTDELLRIELQACLDKDELTQLIRKRFIAESGLTIGRSYAIRSGRFEGRRMLLRYVVIGAEVIRRLGGPVYPLAEGPLDKRGGWNRKHMQTRIEHLDPASEEEA